MGSGMAAEKAKNAEKQKSASGRFSSFFSNLPKRLCRICPGGGDSLLKMTDSDLDLLKHYARDNAQDAFAEIVRRHLGLVHTAALRQVRSPQLAEEVAQSVFTDLARQSPRLAPATILAAWLYEVTRRTAIDVVRREARRQLREQIATEMNVMHATAADWTHIEPLLDEAMHALDVTDRAAVLLRYFENKSLREVGAALGTSDDTAQKRVSRAVERLREFFAQRGVTVGASGLVVVISAHAVQAAPFGLAATLCHAAFMSAAAGTETLGVLKFMTTTKLKVSVISAVVVASAVTTLVIQQQSQANLRSADASLQQQANYMVQLRSENQRLSSLAVLTNRSPANSPAELQRLRDEVAAFRGRASDLAALREEDRQLQATLAKTRKELFYPDRRPIPPTEETKARTWYCMNLAVALLDYALDHQGRIPGNFDQAAKSISERFISEGIEQKTNLTLAQFEIVYQGSRDALTNYAHPGGILLVRERQPWKHPDGRWMKVYAFTDGTGTVHSEPKDQFEAWEKRRILPSTLSKE